MVVLLSDDEAEAVANALRVTSTQLRSHGGTTPAHIDGRGPTDYADQLETLANGDDPTVHIPRSESGTGPAFTTAFDARTFAQKHIMDDVHTVPLRDPKDDGATDYDPEQLEE